MRQIHVQGRFHAGFTLVELMIVIAIVALLSAIAIPGYREHMRRGAVEEGLAELASRRVAIEQYFLDNRTYAGGCGTTNTKSFVINCSGTPNATTYTLQAVGSGNVSGFTYTLNQAGTRTTAGSWGSSSTCWLTKKGDTC